MHDFLKDGGYRIKKVVTELRYSLILIFIFILFRDFASRLFLDYLANPVLSKVSKGYLTDALFLIVIIFLCISAILKFIRNYYVRDSHAIVCMLVVVFYLYYRLGYKPDLLMSSHIMPILKYFDVLLVYFAIPVLLKLAQIIGMHKIVNPVVDGYTMSSVRPIKSKSQDILGRSSKAHKLCGELLSYRYPESLAVGIVGNWGSGKTSFINMVKESFPTNDAYSIIIDFNPWLNISAKSVIHDFFATLEDSLEKYSVDVSRSIKQYSNTVLGIYKNEWTETILKGSEALSDTNLTQGFERLNTLLRHLNKRVYIFIDDFDRLQPAEIFEALKLIRNTAGFDSFTYVVAYDKEYLNDSLKSYGIPKSNSFAEKIFQLEVELLPATVEELKLYLMKRLLSYFPDREEAFKEFMERDINRFWQIGSLRNVTATLTHIRDVERFLNSFIPDFKQVEYDVYFRDYFVLKLIKFKHYNVYSLLFARRDEFLFSEAVSTVLGKSPQYKLKRINKDDRGHGVDYYNVFDGSVLEEHIKNVLRYNESQLQEIMVLVNNLFFNETNKDQHSIAHNVNYEKYFRDEVGLANFPYKEFQGVMLGTFENIKFKFNEWHLEGKTDALGFYLINVKPLELNGRERFENHLKAIFYYGRLEVEGRRWKYNVAGFNFSKLSWIIADEHSYFVKEFYSDLLEFQIFVDTLFADADMPFEFESSFFEWVERHSYGATDSTLSQAKRRGYLVDYFRKYCSKIDTVDDQFWGLFHRCHVKIYPEDGIGFPESQTLDGAKQVFIEFMFKSLDSFLVRLITDTDKRGYNDTGLVGILNPVLDVFGSHEDFVVFLKSKELEDNLSERSEFLPEFIEFAEQLIAAGKMIGFDFKYQPAKEKVERIKNSNRRD